jgi:hypothetical protein
MLRYLTIRKNPILLQLVDIPKCHLEVDELSGGMSVEHEEQKINVNSHFVEFLARQPGNVA